ncbi:NrsF family protein [Parvularcula marina]|uniref:NrsF family protein n=1 Tax=Parvularcula marina TaxID=2292771 RepID=UPI003516E157
MSSDFINGLTATAEPVARRHAGLELLAVLAVAAIELVGFTYFFDSQILAAAYAADPVRMTAKFVIFGALAVAAITLAILSLNPAAKRIGEGTLAIILSVLATSILVFDFTWRGSFSASFVPSAGMHCAISVASLALPVTLVLGMLMMNGASTQPGRSAFLAGLAGGAFGAFVFSLQCPMVSIWYLGLWYGAGIAVVSAASYLLMPKFIRW